MYIEHITILWIAAYVLTILSFYRRDVILFPLLAAGHWFFLGWYVNDMDFVGFGSTNVITWTADIDDFTGLIGLPRFFSGLGIIMIVVALYHLMVISKTGLEYGEKGQFFDKRNM